MAYTAWSVIAGEQPTTSKWNILGANDSSFNDGSGLSALANPLIAASGNHLVLQAATSKVVKSSSVRQDDTTNNYKAGTVVTIYGWGYVAGTGGAFASKAITFPVTFTQTPVAVVTSIGFSTSSGSTYPPTGGPSGAMNSEITAISTTAMTVRLAKYAIAGFDAATTLTSGSNYFFTWMAQGEI